MPASVNGEAGIQSFVHEIVVAASVELVAAGFHGVVEVTAARLTIFRGEVAGLNRDLLDGVHARLVDLVLPLVEAVGGVLPLEVDGLRTGRHAVNTHDVIR